ncbi:molybdenum cofactor guanylyltransferase [Bacillus sp. 31A1R]|uniref:Probable molybdenum cofactor guanylyltransferase n=1 Tax=Robertmurraya mangrovi TaxID=3098077 RepID=A0ABU5IX76_9BACI|nr:molybdenum cofactor guanylyltransferase [Bacillus sp. 31A1R]MDZ5471744.1 molybdenum cofactor guanylyltransferase [Bacillus sp. 31A1R]
MRVTGIILAGGKSSRMGTNKALLKIAGKTVIERIVETLDSVVDEWLVVTNTMEDYRFLQLPMVEDIYRDKGPLAGIHAGLTNTSTEKNIIIACDMPFVSKNLAHLLLNELKNTQAVVPEIDGQLHPLFASYRKDMKDEVERRILKEHLRIRDLLNNSHVKIVKEEDFLKLGYDINKSDFFNMNRPEEYREAIDIDRETNSGN